MNEDSFSDLRDEAVNFSADDVEDQINTKSHGLVLNTHSSSSLTDSDIVVYGPDLKTRIQGAVAPADVITDVLAQGVHNTYDVNVNIGDLFYYMAKNGKEFIFVIADVNQETPYPFKKNVTIMFDQL